MTRRDELEGHVVLILTKREWHDLRVLADIPNQALILGAAQQTPMWRSGRCSFKIGDLVRELKALYDNNPLTLDELRGLHR